MYIMDAMQSTILNSDFVERFLVVDKGDAVLIIASYSQDRSPVTMGRYKNTKEARDVLCDMFIALHGGQSGYTMPDSTLYFEEHAIKDARAKRKGGS